MFYPWFEHGLPRPQRGVLTSRLIEQTYMRARVCECVLTLFYIFSLSGSTGFRSRCLSLAKRPLFRLSYTPLMIHAMCMLNALHGAKNYLCVYAEGGQVGIEPTTSRTQIENHTTRPLTHSLHVLMITLLLRAPRIELGTYCVLSSRHNQLDHARIWFAYTHCIWQK